VEVVLFRFGRRVRTLCENHVARRDSRDRSRSERLRGFEDALQIHDIAKDRVMTVLTCPASPERYCAAKELPYYGFKLGLRIARSGMIIHFPLLPARPRDIQLLDDLIQGFAGLVPADKGFLMPSASPLG
jgi:hypothetical protein